MNQDELTKDTISETPATPPQDEPNLTPETELTQEQIDWRGNERLALEIDVRREYQKQVDDARADIEKKLVEQNEKAFKNVVEQWKKDQTPPTPQEVQALIDGEFPEFPIAVNLKGQPVKGVIRELGAKHERKFVRIVREKAPAHFDIISGAILNFAAGQSTEDKLMAALGTLEPLSGLISEATSIVLTAAIGYEVTAEEIDDSMSTTRQVLLLRAQFDANRLRDFFSHGSRLLKI
jgi:hypothetical protein